MSSRSRDIVRPFGAKKCFTLLRQSDVIFVELMGPSYTRPERFARGVVEHPNMTHVRRVRRAPRPRVARMPYFTPRFWISGLVVICDQMGVSVIKIGRQSLFDQTL